MAEISAVEAVQATLLTMAVVSVYTLTQNIHLGGEIIDNNPFGLAAAAHAITTTAELLEYNYESVRDQLKKAVAVVATTAVLASQQKIVPVSLSITPTIAAHVAMKQGGVPQLLTRTDKANAIRNRAAAIGSRGPAGVGLSWDEYPFASTRQGGIRASVIAVPQMENWKQGGIIGAAYLIENINVGDNFWAVVIP